jgi:hypothetical protein
MSVNSINDPKHWLDRAADMRALAETMADIETKAMMLGLATDCDKLADRAEVRSNGGAAPDWALGGDPHR